MLLLQCFCLATRDKKNTNPIALESGKAHMETCIVMGVIQCSAAVRDKVLGLIS